ncbi:polyketide synthase dehydratase domain-containing protein, partial [Streptomyces sp. NPDC001508]|uniref:polyketide synthase dehydratase domain-containing protein n=1 Tax=Streptomyces sp. NPDC001508 TaxID=3154656 RepID=UPI00332C6AAD
NTTTHTPLPTYPFQHHTYWLHHTPPTNPAGTDHPFLGATVRLADGDRTLLAGRISLAAQPWLADHVVGGHVLLPGTAFVEMALQAGQQVGAPYLSELTLDHPLVLPTEPGADAAVDFQVLIDAAEPGQGRHPFTVYFRAAAAEAHEPWTTHAGGLLVGSGDTPPAEDGLGAESWPPAGATPLDVSSFYADRAEAGLSYGPAFQGLHHAWSRDGEVFAQVVLGEEQHADSDRFAMHPALLDAALHAIGLGSFLARAEQRYVPFAWNGVSLYAVSARQLRVRVSPVGPDAVSLHLSDGAGRAVLTVDRLHLRPLPDTASRFAGGTAAVDRRSLFRTSWVHLPAPRTAQTRGPRKWAVVGEDALLRAFGETVAGYQDVEELGRAVDGDAEAVPDVVFMAAPVSQSGDVAQESPVAAEAAAARALGLAQSWIADERFTDSRLVLVTSGSYLLDTDAPSDGEKGLSNAAVWGLMRSAQSEHPDRFALIDLDEASATAGALTEEQAATLAYALAVGEGQLAAREGTLHVRRLTHLPTPTATPTSETDTTPSTPTNTDTLPWNQGTILITGATGALATHLAHHLITHHHVPHLHLTSRHPNHPALQQLQHHATQHGTHITHTTYDLTNPQDLHHLTNTLNTTHHHPPLTTVIHCA